MSKFTLTVSGYVVVEVEAKDETEAREKALQDTVAGELYDYEFDDIEEE